MTILGVDPGSVRTGWGVIETEGRAPRLLAKGVLVPGRRLPLPARLRLVHDGIAEVIARHQPTLLAVEDAFHSANTRTALVLGHVRGVVLLAGAEAGVAIAEFPPATVKLQTAGFGGADKAQVAFMVARHLHLPGEGEAGDAADALAVALCALAQAGPAVLRRRAGRAS